VTRLHVVDPDSVQPQPWRNGGGVTRELLAWPPGAGGGWLVRVSVADIERDGPFSAYPGVQRGFAVLEGAGVVLDFGARELTLTTASAPLHFDGAEAPGCRLVRGPTRDLNLMALASAGEAHVHDVVEGVAWAPESRLRWRGIFTATPARLTVEHGQAVDLAAGSLAWSDTSETLAAAWRLNGGQTLRAWSLTLAAPAGSPGAPR
jgi:environmental stress-induced protein Ves